jgi:hypothetical protein
MLSEQEERNQWRRFLKSQDEDIALKAFLAWQDRSFGKPPQPVDIDGKLDLIAEVIVNL